MSAPGADIDAARRLDEHQRPRVALQPARQQHLLLVAPRERSHGLFGIVARADGQAIAPAPEGRGLDAAQRMIPNRDSLGQFAAATFSATDRTAECSTRLAVGRQEADACSMAPIGSVERRQLTADLEACPDRDVRSPNADSPTSAAPEPSLPKRATTSPGLTSKVNTIEGCRPKPAPGPAQHRFLADGVGRVLRTSDVCHASPDHGLDHARPVGLLHVCRAGTFRRRAGPAPGRRSR